MYMRAIVTCYKCAVRLQVNTVFIFTSTATEVDNTHFDILPRPLVNTVINNDIEELHLTLTQVSNVSNIS